MPSRSPDPDPSRRRLLLALAGAALLLPNAGSLRAGAARAAAQGADRPMYAYVLTRAGFLRQYRVEGDGALIPLDPPKVRAVTGAGAGATGRVVAHPKGRALYVVGDLPGSDGSTHDAVLQFRIDPATGALTPLDPPSVRLNGRSEGFALHPNGRTAYVADGRGVQRYRVHPETGALTAAGKPIEGGGGILIFAPGGRFAYALGTRGRDGVFAYRVAPGDGALTPLRPAAADTYSHNIVLAPGGRFLYVAGGRPLDTLGADTSATEEDAISWTWQYRVRPDGRLTPLRPARVRTGQGESRAATLPGEPGTVFVWHDSLEGRHAQTWTRFRIQADGTLKRAGLVGENDPALPALRGYADPAGRRAYVDEDDEGELQPFALAAGTPPKREGAPVPVGGDGTRAMAFAQP